jgi:hypothetical protein
MSSIEPYRGFTDRGDKITFDLTVGDMTTDDNWHDWDLSSIVDNGAKAILVRLEVIDGTVNMNFYLRKNGLTGIRNASHVRTQVAGQAVGFDAIVPCDSSQTIEYAADNTTLSAIYLTVGGWWK